MARDRPLAPPQAAPIVLARPAEGASPPWRRSYASIWTPRWRRPAADRIDDFGWIFTLEQPPKGEIVAHHLAGTLRSSPAPPVRLAIERSGALPPASVPDVLPG